MRVSSLVRMLSFQGALSPVGTRFKSWNHGLGAAQNYIDHQTLALGVIIDF